ncbi:MAG: hypothetical protein QF393_03420 [Rhodospirillales bacterium]|jgi:quinol monooxygenase YgiN|nr:hypothetical protein [Rhodospirillaceae bacterium]MDP6427043.1 hypothetical protein [Rhodospirillales bacterium]MDP6645068.1 hypothetical protein [Rhodospirillales bacterium]|tara:strand:+ start:1716 stop:2024 length:309 start_codon:yes stop_codon:yes gene_type:complete
MFGIVIEYDFSGDEAEWQEAIDTFTGQIDADDRLRGRFSYQCNVSNDGGGRIHIGHWDQEETLKHLQGQPYFADFSEKVKKFSGGGPKATGFKRLGGTEGVL